METVHRDYADRGVEFIYVYKALAHPEMNGYVQPVSLEERLMHVKEAKERLGTEWTFICDDMENSIKQAFGNRPNSEFIVSPEGEFLVSRDWSDADALRADLSKFIGPVSEPTRVEDLDMPPFEQAKPAASGVVPRVQRPSGASPLVVEAKQAGDSKEPFYVKLRAEATRDVVRGGEGTVYLGFHLDPLYGVHWNNLVDPIKVVLTPADGVTLSQTTLIGPKVKDESDIDPREFLVDVTGATSDEPLRLTVLYFACNDVEGFCKPVTQEYLVHFKTDPHGGRVMGGGRGGRGGGSGQRNQQLRQMFDRSDADGDGAITREEATGVWERMFDRMDRDGDGKVTFEEAQRERSRGNNRGNRGGGNRGGGARGGGTRGGGGGG